MQPKFQSFTKLSRYETCPRSFKLHYIDKARPEPGVPLRFGKALHEVCERLMRMHISVGRVGQLEADIATDLWSRTWSKHALTDFALFREGLTIVENFVRDAGLVDPLSILAIEEKFEISIGGVNVLGFIDRVDRIADDAIEVIDYKSNRLMCSRAELDHDLQLSIYCIAARKLFPWAKRVKLTHHYLRYGKRMSTSRSVEDLRAVALYVQTLDQQMQDEREWKAQLNPNCQYCEHRGNCLEYQKAVAGNVEVVASDSADLEHVAREREQVAALAKIHYARKRELDEILKAALTHSPALELAGKTFRIAHTTKRRYPIDLTVAALAKAGSMDEGDVRSRVVGIEKPKLDALLRKLKKNLVTANYKLLKAELEANADESVSPRIYTTRAKGGAA